MDVTPGADRREAGRQLASALAPLVERAASASRAPVVVAVPRGGVVVGREVAALLAAPLDVLVLEEVELPFQPSVPLGAVAEGGAVELDADLLLRATVTPAERELVVDDARARLERRVRRVRAQHPRLDLRGRTAIVVVDGVDRPVRARAAVAAVRALAPHRVVLATPLALPGRAARAGEQADDVVVLGEPDPPVDVVDAWYRDAAPAGDAEVVALLGDPRSRRWPRAGPRPLDLVGPPGGDPPRRPIELRAGPGTPPLPASVERPEHPAAVAVLASAASSARHQPSARRLADLLAGWGVATVAVDLLDAEEEVDRGRVLDLGLLAGRLGSALADLAGVAPDLGRLPTGLAGATAAGSASLLVAGEADRAVAAIALLGPRLDLLAERIPGALGVPALLVVGGEDPAALDVTRAARDLLAGPSRLVVVPGASPGLLGQDARETALRLGADWLGEHLVGPPT